MLNLLIPRSSFDTLAVEEVAQAVGIAFTEVIAVVLVAIGGRWYAGIMGSLLKLLKDDELMLYGSELKLEFGFKFHTDCS